MKPRILIVGTILLVLLGMATSSHAAPHREATPNPEPPLRLSEPLDAVVADLDGYIPPRMDEAGVPGLAMALIRDGQVAWTQGYGLANTLTRKPVTEETVFEVASISKAVAAYIALQLVQQGDLSLDEPVTRYLSEAWLPASEHGDAITLRQLLTHSSGLTNQVNPLSKTMSSAPGETYAYSGVGFVYLQEILEQVSGQSLEELAGQLVFEPLGMASSSYVNPKEIRPILANGHCDLGPFLLPVIVMFVVLLAITGLAGAVIQRLRTGRWTLSWRMVGLFYLLATLLGVAIAELLMGPGARKWTLLSLLWLASVGLALASVGLIARQVLCRLPALQERPRRFKEGLTIGCIAAGTVGLLWLTAGLASPVPKEPDVPPNAAYSLRSTAGDLARFLIELADPQFLDESLAAEMRTAQVRVNDSNSWGLGLGIQHSAQGNALWHGGDNRDFHAMMVIYPDAGLGVVVLTNGEQGQTVAHDVAGRALGGKADWRNWP